jgi:Leucine-rich repeat (LRR) protein
LIFKGNGQTLNLQLLLDWYNGLSNLIEQTTIDLSSKKISSISANTFSNLINLTESLILTNNKLTYIDSNTFYGLSSLNSLYLDKNQIRSLSPNAFNGLSKLCLLDLGNNPLNSLTDSSIFDGLNALYDLKLQNCSITNIDQNIFTNLLNNPWDSFNVYLYGNPITNNRTINLQTYLCPAYSNCKIYSTSRKSLSNNRRSSDFTTFF